MNKKSSILLEYQENFADNFTVLAYGKILEKDDNFKCFYENKTSKRQKLEETMADFNLNFDFVSTKKSKHILSENHFFKKILTKNKEILNKKAKNNLIAEKHFDILDIPLLNSEIKNSFKFNNIDFIKNFDILDKIKSTNSIGLYISQKDEILKTDNDFIFKATKRLNKYVKKPKLFIFTKIKNFNFNSFVDFEIVDLSDWREEYYFLSNCKHKIILQNKNSYSQNFWASVLNRKEHFYVIYKKQKNSAPFQNWIGV